VVGRVRPLIVPSSRSSAANSIWEPRSGAVKRLDLRFLVARAFFAQIIRKYEGTRLRRQELEAEVLDDVPGAL
jgi:hypothetical protein